MFGIVVCKVKQKKMSKKLPTKKRLKKKKTCCQINDNLSFPHLPSDHGVGGDGVDGGGFFVRVVCVGVGDVQSVFELQ